MWYGYHSLLKKKPENKPYYVSALRADRGCPEGANTAPVPDFGNALLRLYLYSSAAMAGSSILVLSYQWKPVSMVLGRVSPFMALTAASTHL